MIPYSINGSFICEHCRNECRGKCHDRLTAIMEGKYKPGDEEYEANKDLIGRKQIIRCLGPYCDKPCRYKLDEFTPYKESDGIEPLINLIKYLGNEVHKLIEEKYKNCLSTPNQ